MRVVLLAACVLIPALASAQVAPCPDLDSEPPLASPVLYRCAEIVLHPVNETMLEPMTYGRRLQASWSRPSAQHWAPYDEAAIRDDFRRLWDTGFLDNLWVEVIDEPYRNGVMGKHVVFHLEERARLKLVDYALRDDTQRMPVSISTIEEALAQREISLKLDAFIDQTTIARASAIVRELYANEGFGDAIVESERRALDSGTKLLALTFRITPGPRSRIRDIVFDGNETFSDAVLRRQLKDNRVHRWLPFLGDDTYRPSKFPDDADRLREFYQRRGFPLVQIGQPQVERLDAEPGDDVRWVRLRVPLDEGGRHLFGKVDITGATTVPIDAVRRIFDVTSGEPYSVETIRQGLERLREIYGALGFWRWSPEIDQQPAEPSTTEPAAAPVMDVSLAIDEGRRFFINRVSFAGNSTTHDSVLRRELMILEGGVFSSEALKTSLRRINQLGFIEPIDVEGEDVTVTAAPGIEDRVDVAIKVREQNRNQFTFGAGVSQLSGFFGQLAFQTGNFLGRGETLSVSAQRGSMATAYDVSVSSPYLFGRPISGGLQVFSRKNDYYMTNGALGYSEVRSGVAATGGRFVAPFTRLYLTLTRERVHTEVLDSLKDADPGDLLGTPLFNAAFDEGVHQESRLAPSLVYNTVDRPDRPRRGLRLTGKSDLAVRVLGGTVEYVRPEVEAIVYVPHTSRTALGFRGSMGWLMSRAGTETLPYYRRYFLGGETDIRGTELRSVGPLDTEGRAVGGTRSVLFNLEYYLDIGPVRALAFHDAGQAYAEGNAIDLRRLRTSTGVEARFLVPMINVPMRVIYAWNFYRDTFQAPHTFKFGVGTTF